MTTETKKSEFKSKIDLIENINQQSGDPNKIIKKIVRQTKVFTKNSIEKFRESFTKNAKNRLKFDWDKFECEIKEVFIQWKKKQTQDTIDRFLEGIKLSLKEKNGVVLNGYFSLKIKSEATKRRCIKHQNSIDVHKTSNCCNKSRGIEAYAKCKKFKKITQDIKNCNRCHTEKKKGGKNHISFRASPKLKKEIS